MAQINSWSYQNPVCVVAAGIETLSDHIPEQAVVLLVTSSGFVRRGVTSRIERVLPGRAITVMADIQPNPDLTDLDRAIVGLRKMGITHVVALGGGSALDAAKSLAVTLPSDVDTPLAATFREGIKFTWTRRLPLIAIPTTAGTGAEVTPFATVWDHEQFRKHSLSGPLMFPDVALLDAELTLTLPEQETLYPGLDAISHALESLWNRNCTPVSRAFSLQSLALASKALPALLQEPNDIEFRRRMQAASLLSGMAISQTRTALAHSISYPLTARFGVPHGLACSFTLPVLLEDNLYRLSTSDADLAVLRQTLEMLRSFQLGSHVRRFVETSAVLQLEAEMLTPGRADNYDGPDARPLADLIRVALS
jgi:phosphonate metabolism-associated iron-containing alcohol dehydrogenase